MRDEKGRFVKGNKLRVGMKHTKEAKLKMSLASMGHISPMKGKKRWWYSPTEFKKGHIPWLKGKHIKINNALNDWYKNGGVVWNKDKKFQEISGQNHHNWKGGITPLYNKIRCSLENKDWIKQVFLRDNYTCQNCYKKGGDLESHHIKSFAQILKEFLEEYNQFSPIEDKETLLRLLSKYKPFWDLANGKTLCKDCHNLVKMGKATLWT